MCAHRCRALTISRVRALSSSRNWSTRSSDLSRCGAFRRGTRRPTARRRLLLLEEAVRPILYMMGESARERHSSKIDAPTVS